MSLKKLNLMALFALLIGLMAAFVPAPSPVAAAEHTLAPGIYFFESYSGRYSGTEADGVYGHMPIPANEGDVMLRHRTYSPINVTTDGEYNLNGDGFLCVGDQPTCSDLLEYHYGDGEDYLNQPAKRTLKITGIFHNNPGDGRGVYWQQRVNDNWVTKATCQEGWYVPSCEFTTPTAGDYRIFSTDSVAFFDMTPQAPERGNLKVVKVVQWNGNPVNPEAKFTIDITGPNFSESVEFGPEGGEKVFTDLLPGTYTVTERDPGGSWTVSGNGPIDVVANDTATATITNSLRPRDEPDLPVYRCHVTYNWNCEGVYAWIAKKWLAEGSRNPEGIEDYTYAVKWIGAQSDPNIRVYDPEVLGDETPDNLSDPSVLFVPWGAAKTFVNAAQWDTRERRWFREGQTFTNINGDQQLIYDPNSISQVITGIMIEYKEVITYRIGGQLVREERIKQVMPVAIPSAQWFAENCDKQKDEPKPEPTPDPTPEPQLRKARLPECDYGDSISLSAPPAGNYIKLGQFYYRTAVVQELDPSCSIPNAGFANWFSNYVGHAIQRGPDGKPILTEAHDTIEVRTGDQTNLYHRYSEQLVDGGSEIEELPSGSPFIRLVFCERDSNGRFTGRLWIFTYLLDGEDGSDL